MLRIFRAKPVASPLTSNQGRPTPPAWRGPVSLLLAPGAMIATIAFSCNNKDSIWITDPNATGGSSGGTGTAGAGGSGSGGTAGNGGDGGSGISGAAGTMGGSGGSGAGGSGGSAGSAGTAGTAGTGGTVETPDSGVDGGDVDSGGGGPQLTAHQQTATSICALEDQVDNCPASASNCRDALVTQWEGFQASADPSCAATIDAYFNCVAIEPVSSYDCNGQVNPPDDTSPAPEVIVPAVGGCVDQENAFFATFDPTFTCN